MFNDADPDNYWDITEMRQYAQDIALERQNRSSFWHPYLSALPQGCLNPMCRPHPPRLRASAFCFVFGRYIGGRIAAQRE